MVSRDAVFMVLKNVEDPEIMMNVVDLGLVYRVDVKESNRSGLHAHLPWLPGRRNDPQ